MSFGEGWKLIEKRLTFFIEKSILFSVKRTKKIDWRCQIAGKHHKDLPLEEIKSLYLEGMSLRDLAQKYRVGKDTISRRLAAMGIDTSKPVVLPEEKRERDNARNREWKQRHKEEREEYERERHKKYRKENSERIRENQKKYTQKHQDQIKAHQKEYRETHKEIIIKRRAEHYRLHRDEIRERRKRRRETRRVAHYRNLRISALYDGVPRKTFFSILKTEEDIND